MYPHQGKSAVQKYLHRMWGVWYVVAASFYWHTSKYAQARNEPAPSGNIQNLHVLQQTCSVLGAISQISIIVFDGCSLNCIPLDSYVRFIFFLFSCKGVLFTLFSLLSLSLSLSVALSISPYIAGISRRSLVFGIPWGPCGTLVNEGNGVNYTHSITLTRAFPIGLYYPPPLSTSSQSSFSFLRLNLFILYWYINNISKCSGDGLKFHCSKH